jgi:hypothetical protein
MSQENLQPRSLDQIRLDTQERMDKFRQDHDLVDEMPKVRKPEVRVEPALMPDLRGFDQAQYSGGLLSSGQLDSDR